MPRGTAAICSPPESRSAQSQEIPVVYPTLHGADQIRGMLVSTAMSYENTSLADELAKWACSPASDEPSLHAQLMMNHLWALGYRPSIIPKTCRDWLSLPAQEK